MSRGVLAAICPHPPLIVPELARGAAGELDGLRRACDAAVEVLLAAAPAEVVVVGAAPSSGAYPADAVADFAGYGPVPDVAAHGAVPSADREPGSAPTRLPLSLSVGAWL
ncbi:MAG: hypothetical protein ACYCYA_12975, partial [Actinomycetes bacterium]